MIPLLLKNERMVVYIQRRRTSKYRRDDRLKIEADKQAPNTEDEKEKTRRRGSNAWRPGGALIKP